MGRVGGKGEGVMREGAEKIGERRRVRGVWGWWRCPEVVRKEGGREWGGGGGGSGLEGRERERLQPRNPSI